MTEALAPTLAVAAATVGALHALAPDHWLPIAAVSRARGWSLARTTRVALLCGFGHVTVSALLGVLALVSGTAVVEALGARSASVAGVLLIGFGAAYGLWGLRKLAHHHTHAQRDPSRTTVWTLFAIYCADPCIAVVPIVFAAASLSRVATVAIVVVYELATIGTMVALTAIARAGAGRLHGRWVERYGDATAGGLIVATGVLVALIGW
jgi:nickel/cobalt transporter (NicO) family protein